MERRSVHEAIHARDALARRVADVFIGPRIQRIDFHLGGLHISPQRLGSVGQAIRQGRIRVEVASTGSMLSAAYSPHHNRMTIQSEQVLSEVTGQAGIVHEGVHALVDLFRATSTTVLSDEAAAYLAEVIYLRAAHTWVRGSAAVMAIYNAADRIAQAHRMYERTGAVLRFADYEPLRQAVNAHPAYSSIGQRQLTSGHGVP